ncbi:glycosyltransferase family 87 protein [Sphaerisporangium sp. NPDC088356]|uniref:glycosyltransferase family 87 protein n=1 Tax=Sphaerisporangium sp. NPDC088356 TaxID=3154871 RepID=UPI00342EDF53
MTQASLPARIAAAVVLMLPAAGVIRRGSAMQDNGYVVKAARALLSGHSPYADERFLYLPSSAVAALAEAWLDDRTIQLVFPFVLAVLTLSGWSLALGLCGVRVGSRLGLLGMAAIALLFGYRSLLAVGNWSVVAVVAFPAALLLCARNRWSAAAVVAGVSIALKPMLVPLALLFLFARRRRALVILVAVPLLLVLLSLPLTPEPGRFVSDTLPFLLHGQDEYAKPYDASLASILPRLGAGSDLTLAIRAVVAVAGLLLAWTRWRLPDDTAVLDRSVLLGEPVGVRNRAGGYVLRSLELRLVETASMIMVTVFLVFTPGFGHYSLVILLPLAATAIDRRSVARSPWFWVALAPQFPGVEIPGLTTPQTRAFTVFFMHGVLALLLAFRTARTSGEPSGSGDPHDLGEWPEEPIERVVVTAGRRPPDLGAAGG